MDFEEGEIDDQSESDAESLDIAYRELHNSPVPQSHKHAKVKRSSKRGRHASSPFAQRDNSPAALQSRNRFNDADHRNKSFERHEDNNNNNRRRQHPSRTGSKRPGRMDSTNSKKLRKEPIRKIESRCKYFQLGKCHKGDACIYSHQPTSSKKELCKFYAAGTCSKIDTCVYLHEDFPCKFFHLSNNCQHGTSCKFSHAPLTEETEAMLLRSVAKASDDKNEEKYSTDSTVRPRPQALGVFAGVDTRGDIDYRIPNHTVPYDRNMDMRPPPNQPHFPFQRPHFDAAPRYRVPFRPNRAPEYRINESAPLLGDPDFRPRLQMNRDQNSFQPRGRFVRPGFNPGPLIGGFRDPTTPMPMISEAPPGFHQSRFDGPMRLPGPPPFAGQLLPGMPLPFRPPFISRPPLLPCNNNPMALNPAERSEAMLSSELDKIAQLLASSIPNTAPATDSGAENHDSAPDVDLVKKQLPLLTDPEPVKPEEAIQDPPDCNTPAHSSVVQTNEPEDTEPIQEPTNQLSLQPAVQQWRLIPLDMNVKIPYPLMSLDISNLPHRFEDPRLKGQLSTLHLPPRFSSNTSNILGESTTRSNATEQGAAGLLSPSSSNSTTETSRESSSYVRQGPNTVPAQQVNALANNLQVGSGLASPPHGRVAYSDNPLLRVRRISNASLESTGGGGEAITPDCSSSAPRIDLSESSPSSGALA